MFIIKHGPFMTDKTISNLGFIPFIVICVRQRIADFTIFRIKDIRTHSLHEIKLTVNISIISP